MADDRDTQASDSCEASNPEHAKLVAHTRATEEFLRVHRLQDLFRRAKREGVERELELLLEDLSVCKAHLRRLGESDCPAARRKFYAEQAFRNCKSASQRYIAHLELHDSFLTDQLVKLYLECAVAAFQISNPLPGDNGFVKYRIGVYIQEVPSVFFQTLLLWCLVYSFSSGFQVAAMLVAILLARTMIRQITTRGWRQVDDSIRKYRTVLFGCLRQIEDEYYDPGVLRRRLLSVEDSEIYPDTIVFQLLRIRRQQPNRPFGTMA